MDGCCFHDSSFTFQIIFHACSFIIEAIVLCILGGILGILLGILIVYGFTVGASFFDTDFPFSIPIYAIIGSLSFSALVGLFFGIWPARRAARLDPAVSLRYE